MKKSRSILDYTTGALFNVAFIALTVAVIYFAVTKSFAYGKSLFVDNLDRPYEEFTVDIPEGEEEGRADAYEIGKILEETGLTENAWIFYIQARLNGTFDKFYPGTYNFNTHMGAGEIMDIIQQAQFAPVSDTRITIPEGLNLRQIGDLCESKGLFTAQEFLAACAQYSHDYYFLEVPAGRPNPLEGYLFPDTYFLPENPEPKDLIDRMLTRFQEVFTFEMEERAAGLNMTVDQVITVAAIIEKEIKVASERALCSSIIYNRLKSNTPLQMCSTVLYVLDKQKDRLLISDTEIDSPYNTYKYSGLPYGPICSPGKEAILAALNPADTNYLYMVVSDENKGEHFFTSNYQEFLDAKTRYNQQF